MKKPTYTITTSVKPGQTEAEIQERKRRLMALILRTMEEGSASLEIKKRPD